MGILCSTGYQRSLINDVHVQIDSDDGKVSEECSAMIRCHDKLVSALSIDLLSIAGILLSKGFISEEINAKMLIHTSTNHEKSTILANTLREKIKSNSSCFYELLDLLYARTSTKDVADLLLDTYQGDSSTNEYAHFLRNLYTSLTPTHTIPNQWPPVIARQYYEVAMIEHNHVRTSKTENGHDIIQQAATVRGKIDDVLHKCAIKLENIFPEDSKDHKFRRRLVLIEGVPGSGKSTLSIHIAQKVSNGQLFPNLFSTVILVRLRDTKVHNTISIADLLPCKNLVMSHRAAKNMFKNNGRGVLFILDGWDELPLELRTNSESIFYKLTKGEHLQNNSVFESSVIVTSRPAASNDLHMVASSRIEIVGFTKEKLEAYFTDCLNGDTKALKTLQEQIQENPSLTGICSLPLNASVVVHLSKCLGNKVFTITQYGILSEVILNCMIHNQGNNNTMINTSQLSLKNLPENLRSQFLKLCELAYEGVNNNQFTFSGDQISSYSLPCTSTILGLLQGIESFQCHEVSTSYSFFHESVQELLAAHHMEENLSDKPEAQVLEFDKLFHSSRLNTVCCFFAAITELKTPGMIDFINTKADFFGKQRPNENKSLLLSLLHCLHESQNFSLCQSVARKLKLGLDLRGKTLSASDCLSVGFFLSSVIEINFSEFKIKLDCCQIGDQGCKYIVNYLPACGATNLITQLSLSMEHNDISYHGIQHLSKLLTTGYSVSHFSLSHNQLSRNDHFELFSRNISISVRHLHLANCNLNSESVANLALLLVNNKHNIMETLNLSNNALCDSGIQCLSQAFRINQSLKMIDICNCGIQYAGLESLASSLVVNTSIEEIFLHNFNDESQPNLLTEDVIPILIDHLSRNSTLSYLVLPMELEMHVSNIQEAVNEKRRNKGSQFLEITVTIQGSTLREIEEYITRKEEIQMDPDHL